MIAGQQEAGAITRIAWGLADKPDKLAQHYGRRSVSDGSVGQFIGQ